MNAGIVLSFHGSMEAMLDKYSGRRKYIPEFLVIDEYSKRFDKVFVFSHDSKRFGSALPKNAVQVRLYNRFFYLFFGWLVVLFHTLRGKIRIIYVECGSSLLPVFLVNRLTRAKVVLNYDNTWFMAIKKPMKRFVIKSLEHFLLRFVDYFTVASSEIRSFTGKREGIIGVKKGIILSQYDPDSVKAHKIFRKIKGKAIIYTGHLSPVKDPITLIRAYKIAREKYKDLHLIICGDGELRKDCEKIADENVHFMGFVGDVPSLLKGSDIFVLTSVYDASPKSLMEAMAMGLPSVATDVGGIPDHLDESCGFLVKPKNPKETAEKILYLLGNPAVSRKMGERARNKMLKYHNLKTNLKKVMDFLIREVGK